MRLQLELIEIDETKERCIGLQSEELWLAAGIEGGDTCALRRHHDQADVDTSRKESGGRTRKLGILDNAVAGIRPLEI